MSNETAVLIVRAVSFSFRDLLSLRAVNKAFCACATLAAFRTVGATNRRSSALNLVSLLESDLASLYVREVIYFDGAADESGMRLTLPIEYPLLQALEPSASHLLILTLANLTPIADVELVLTLLALRAVLKFLTHLRLSASPKMAKNLRLHNFWGTWKRVLLLEDL
ncbi:hypothetical protein FA95DRAFT_1610528 [Auriscalpium vulgare]|uniref:Uncharacterized protein n=1 Tax=Auriscalpium vulgare TaxID=40419 RepID=A0ACB8RDF2_9AGAM|nr:hypothetical protein FA95DRAFT_1610528 [Auriscalpium vulgare]